MGRLLLFCLLVLASMDKALSVERVNRAVFGDVWTLDDDIFITENGYLDLLGLELVGVSNVKNNGIIYGDIIVSDGASVTFQNSGEFHGDIVLGRGANFTQIVRGVDDMGRLNVSGPFGLSVENAGTLSLCDIVAMGATDISISNTALQIDADFVADVPRIKLDETIVIFIDNWAAFDNRPLIYNVYGDATIEIYERNGDPMYNLEAYIDKGALFAMPVRETDYVKIMGDASGEFLNALREIDPKDNLLAHLDRAATMDELRSVMDKSVRMRPLNLMNTVRVMDAMILSDAEMMADSHAGVGPLYIFGDDYYIYGANIDAGFYAIDKLFIGGGVYAGISDYSDDINDYSATIYGLNLRARYDLGHLFVRAGMTASHARFDIGPVFDGAGIVFNPTGRNLYGAADVGANFTVLERLRLMPFVGMTMMDSDILQETESDTSLRAGTQVAYDTTILGMRYVYALRADMNTASQISAMMHLNVTSVEDGAGLYAAAGVLRDQDLGMSVKISFTASLKF